MGAMREVSRSRVVDVVARHLRIRCQLGFALDSAQNVPLAASSVTVGRTSWRSGGSGRGGGTRGLRKIISYLIIFTAGKSCPVWLARLAHRTNGARRSVDELVVFCVHLHSAPTPAAVLHCVDHSQFRTVSLVCQLSPFKPVKRASFVICRR